MTQATIPCPAMSDGTARECGHCPEEIPIGAPALLNPYGVPVHPKCIDTIAGAFGIARSATDAPAKDLGDEVAELMMAKRGKAPAVAATATPATEGDFGDQVIALMRAKRGQR